MPCLQRVGRAGGDAGARCAGRAGATLVQRRRRDEVGVGNRHGPVGVPAAPFDIDADHDRRRLVPAGQFAQRLQTDGLLAREQDAATLPRQLLGEPAFDGAHAVIVDRVVAADAGCLHAFPQPSSGVAEEDQLPLASLRCQLGDDVLRQVGQVEDELPVEPGRIQDVGGKGLALTHFPVPRLSRRRGAGPPSRSVRRSRRCRPGRAGG